MLYELKPITLPTMLFWENENTWYGSKGTARFYLQTQKVEDAPEGQPSRIFKAEVWPGPFTKALSETVAEATFPLTEEGRDQMIAWLEGQAEEMNKEW